MMDDFAWTRYEEALAAIRHRTPDADVWDVGVHKLLAKRSSQHASDEFVTGCLVHSPEGLSKYNFDGLIVYVWKTRERKMLNVGLYEDFALALGEREMRRLENLLLDEERRNGGG